MGAREVIEVVSTFHACVSGAFRGPYVFYAKKQAAKRIHTKSPAGTCVALVSHG